MGITFTQIGNSSVCAINTYCSARSLSTYITDTRQAIFGGVAFNTHLEIFHLEESIGKVLYNGKIRFTFNDNGRFVRMPTEDDLKDTKPKYNITVIKDPSKEVQ